MFFLVLEGGEAEAEGCRRRGNRNIIWDDWASARNLDSGEGTSVVKGGSTRLQPGWGQRRDSFVKHALRS